MIDPERALQLYERLCSFRSARRATTIFGVLDWAFGDEAERQEAEMLRPEIAEAVRSIDSTREGQRMVCWAPSPWHAYFVCLQLNERRFRSDQSGLAFRGQPDSRLKLVASSHRKDNGANAPVAALVAGLAAHIDEAMGLDLGDDVRLAVAQHYGARTPLLDFTTDPAVALFFADMEGFEDADECSLFCIAPDNLFAAGGRVLLAPPYAKRLHAQCGLFLEMKEAASADGVEGLLELRFPKARGRKRFNVIRAGRQADLLAEDWIVRAANKLHAEYMQGTADRDGVDDLIAAVLSELDDEVWVYDRALHARMLGNWIVGLSDTLLDICGVVRDGNEYIIEAQLRQIIADNPQLMLLYGRMATAATDHVHLSAFGATILQIYEDLHPQLQS